MKKPFKGTTEECVKDFVKTRGIDVVEHREFKKRNAVAKLLGVSQVSASGWFDENCTLPKGENLLRLRYLLLLIGYEPIERKGMSKLMLEFSDQIALRALTIEEVASYIGTNTEVPMGWVMGRSGASPEREVSIKELVELHRESAAKIAEEWKVAIHSFGLNDEVEDSSEEAEVQNNQLSDELVIKTLAHQILATLSLAERALSDDFSPEHRRRLRELTTNGNGRSNAVFDLSNLLNRLCGERARREIK